LFLSEVGCVVSWDTKVFTHLRACVLWDKPKVCSFFSWSCLDFICQLKMSLITMMRIEFLFSFSSSFILFFWCHFSECPFSHNYAYCDMNYEKKKENLNNHIRWNRKSNYYGTSCIAVCGGFYFLVQHNLLVIVFIILGGLELFFLPEHLCSPQL